jgi:RNA polymerase II subunit A-like phosphatase
MLDLKDASRLLKARKLTLIIDLDQTIIHASLNTKIAEWMSDPENINYPATHDIGKFTLNDSPSIYYIKPRPFLKRFLEELNPLYEFHIYTMGVRSYALEVVKIIDPEGKYFRERIITRDENLSSTKSISRLFPTDQSMVAAIDDRADVWEWSPNLIRVVPFEFFPGTGDINASHLPELKKDDVSSIVPSTESTSETKDEKDTNTDSNDKNGTDDAKETNGEVPGKKEDELEESQAAKPTTTGQVQNGHVAQLTEDDKELVLTLKQLKRLHELFYRYQDSPDLQRADNLQPTVPSLLPHMKSEVLKGVYITFSGIIPIDANPRK